MSCVLEAVVVGWSRNRLELELGRAHGDLTVAFPRLIVLLVVETYDTCAVSS